MSALPRNDSALARGLGLSPKDRLGNLIAEKLLEVHERLMTIKDVKMEQEAGRWKISKLKLEIDGLNEEIAEARWALGRSLFIE